MAERYSAYQRVVGRRYYELVPRLVETIGNANEEIIRAYGQDQLKRMNKHEDGARQLGLL